MIQCPACAVLSEEQWFHLRKNFAKMSTYSNHLDLQGNSFEEPERTDELVFTSDDLSWVDHTLLNLESLIQMHLLLESVSHEHPGSLTCSEYPYDFFNSGSGSSVFHCLPPCMSQTVSQVISLPGQVPHTSPGRQSVVDKMVALFFP